MKFFIGIIGLLAIITIGQSNDNIGERVHYYGYKVYHVTIETEDQFNALLALKNNSLDVMFWQLSHSEHYADIMVGPKHIEKFLQMLSKYNLKYEVTIEDAEDILNNSDNMVKAIALEDNHHVTYAGYKVYHVTFKTDEQFEVLRKMQILPSNQGISFWQLAHKQKYADIMVAPTKEIVLLDFLNAYDFKYECTIEDVSKTIKYPEKLITNEGKKSYRDYKVYNVQFTTEEQFKILYQMLLDSGVRDFSVLQLSHLRKTADIMVGPTEQQSVIDILNKNRFTYKLAQNDISAISEPVSYSGFKVYEVKFNTEEQYNILVNLMYNGSTDLSFWHLAHDTKVAHIMVGPAQLSSFTDFLRKNKMTFKIMIEDVGKHVKYEV